MKGKQWVGIALLALAAFFVLGRGMLPFTFSNQLARGIDIRDAPYTFSTVVNAQPYNQVLGSEGEVVSILTHNTDIAAGGVVHYFEDCEKKGQQLYPNEPKLPDGKSSLSFTAPTTGKHLLHMAVIVSQQPEETGLLFSRGLIYENGKEVGSTASPGIVVGKSTDQDPEDVFIKAKLACSISLNDAGLLTQPVNGSIELGNTQVPIIIEPDKQPSVINQVALGTGTMFWFMLAALIGLGLWLVFK